MENSALLAAGLAYLMIQKTESVYYSEMSVNMCQTTWHHIPEDSSIQKDVLKAYVNM
jgi:hypothetical protein